MMLSEWKVEEDTWVLGYGFQWQKLQNKTMAPEIKNDYSRAHQLVDI